MTRATVGSEVNNSFNISGRPFYFARIIIDPKNPDRLSKSPILFHRQRRRRQKLPFRHLHNEGPDTVRA